MPQRDHDTPTSAADNDKIKIKSFLYCMNVAAYDLKFVNELKDLFGYRESFENHHKSTLQFMADICGEWMVDKMISDVVVNAAKLNIPSNLQSFTLVK